MDYDAWALYLIGSLIAGFVSAFLTYWLKRKATKEDKWWDLKVSTYQEGLFNIAALRFVNSQWLNHIEKHIELSEDETHEISEKKLLAKKNLKHAASIGSFLISEEASNIIKKLIIELENIHSVEGNFDEELSDEYDLLNMAHTDFLRAAKKDIKIRVRKT